jgi:hypothetical protein
MGLIATIRSIRLLARRCKYYWLGPTTAHLRLEAFLLASLAILTLGYMNNLHEGVNMADVRVIGIFTMFLSRHLLLRLLLSWDPATARSPRNFITVFLQSHVLQGTTFDRRCRDVASSQIYEWTDIVPSSILYLYQVAQVYMVRPLAPLLWSSKMPPLQHSHGGGGSSSHDAVHNSKKPMVDGSSTSSSRWFFWRQRVYTIWFEHVAPRVSFHWFLWHPCALDGLLLAMRIYYADALPTTAAAQQRHRHGTSLDRLVILTGTALHRLDDAVVATGDDESLYRRHGHILLYRQYYMAAIVTSVFTTGRLWNAPPDFYKTPSLWGSVLYLFGRWLELVLLLDLLPVQSCRATGHCHRHCALASTGYADFRREDCDDPDVFFAWTFLLFSATTLLVGTLGAQWLTHSYTIWKDAVIRAQDEWKLVEKTPLSSLMTMDSWKDTAWWESLFVEKERYHRGERYFAWWGRRTYECLKATSRPPPSLTIDGLTATTPKLEWLVPLAQLQWLIAALYMIVWLVRFFFFGIYSAWVYGLYAMVAHSLAAYAVTYPAPRIRELAQEVNDRPKTFRL